MNLKDSQLPVVLILIAVQKKMIKDTRENPGKLSKYTRFFCLGSVKMSENWHERKNVAKSE